MLARLLITAALAQAPVSSAPYARSHVDAGDLNSPVLYWTATSVRWNPSAAGNPVNAGDSEFAAMRRSFASWNEVLGACGNFSLVEGDALARRDVGYREDPNENVNLVLFRTESCSGRVPTSAACRADNSCGNVYDCWDYDARTIGLTTTTYDVKTGIVYDSDIELNAASFEFTTADGAACGADAIRQDCVGYDVENTLTHEVGHLVGLDHTTAQGSTMNPRAPAGETSKRTIDPGSRAFICEVYPKGGASVGSFIPQPPPTGSQGGCAAAGGAGLALALLGPALRLLSLRRRRS